MVIGNLNVYGVIYKVINKINHKVYIGQTTRGFEKRYRFKGVGVERMYNNHKSMRDNGYPYNSHLLNSIEKYGFDSFDVSETIDVSFSKEELNIKEKLYIEIFDSYRNGYNKNLGGEGNSGYDGFKGENNPNSRKVVQLSLNGDYIKTWNCISDAEDSLNVARSHIGCACDNQYGRKSSHGFLWIDLEDYDINKSYLYKKDIPVRKIIQLDLNYKIIKQYNSSLEASMDSGISEKQIYAGCGKKTHYASGYIWYYLDDFSNSNIKKYKDPKLKPVIQIDKISGDVVNLFESITDASLQTGISKKSISAVCRGRDKSAKGYVWVLNDEYDSTKNYKVIKNRI